MLTALVAAVVGAVAGMHAATWGAYKDSVYEGFSPLKWVRSVAIGGLCAILLQPWVAPEVPRASALLVLFGVAYVAERGVFEMYKTFLRQEDQSKYHIPMQFHVFGRIVTGRGARVVAGAALVAALALVILAMQALQRAGAELPRLILSAIAGAVAGLLSAIMGAWKDAPIEGFETRKFFRSPLIATGYAILLAPMARDLVPLGATALGFTIATIETYKTFYDGRPPGKFSGKPVLHPYLLAHRGRWIPLFVTIWGAAAAAAVLAWHDAVSAGLLAQLVLPLGASAR